MNHLYDTDSPHIIQIAKFESSKAKALRLATAQQQLASNFANQLLRAVDDNRDRGLSMCELKAAELGRSKSGVQVPMFRKAAMWLQTGRNFQLYDSNSDGVITLDELTNAMLVFLQTHWKYDGVLWGGVMVVVRGGEGW